jgi:hypothetical protein
MIGGSDNYLDIGVLISLAPSACQAEARWKGFHTVGLSKSNGVLKSNNSQLAASKIAIEMAVPTMVLNHLLVVALRIKSK